jgi:hypothetical protein
MRRVLFIAVAAGALVAAYLMLGGLLAQILLSGISDQQVHKSRILAWLVYCPLVGLLVLSAVHLIRRAIFMQSTRVGAPTDKFSVWSRAVLFPCAWILLCGSAYFADLAWYLGRHPSAPTLGSSTRALSGSGAVVLLGAAVVCLLLARRRSA